MAAYPQAYTCTPKYMRAQMLTCVHSHMCTHMCSHMCTRMCVPPAEPPRVGLVLTSLGGPLPT